MIHLIPVTKDNFFTALDMKITEDQYKYLFPVERSLAECYVNENYHPYIIFNEEIPVGFVLLSWIKEKNYYKVIRFMIDKRYQRQGLGTAAMKAIIQFFKDLGATKIVLSHEIENPYPARVYLSVGFKYTGEIVGIEKMMELDL